MVYDMVITFFTTNISIHVKLWAYNNYNSSLGFFEYLAESNCILSISEIKIGIKLYIYSAMSWFKEGIRWNKNTLNVRNVNLPITVLVK